MDTAIRARSAKSPKSEEPALERSNLNRFSTWRVLEISSNQIVVYNRRIFKGVVTILKVYRRDLPVQLFIITDSHCGKPQNASASL